MDLLQRRHSTYVALSVVVTAIIATVAFHFLFYSHQYGIAFAIFILILVAGVFFMTIMTGMRGNAWAHLFLIPIVFCLIAQVLYASEVVRGVGFLVAVGSLILFTYWYPAPRERFWSVKTLWPTTLFTETFWPFTKLSDFFHHLVIGKRQVTKAVIGILIAIPFILVIGVLFMNADPLIKKTVEDILTLPNFNVFFSRLIWDVIAILFFVSSGWMIATRLLDHRSPKEHGSHHSFDAVVITSFLVVLNILFAVFLGFQAVYFFGGEAFIQSQGLTYADYAREGFFHLLAVSFIVLAVITAIYRYSKMHSWSIRGFSLLLILQTIVMIISAVRRLMLYIDAYNLTVARFWALLIIFVIAAIFVFGIVAIVAKLEYAMIAKGTVAALLILISAGLLINAEKYVARYNIDRYMDGETERLDVLYFTTLSSDAVPELVDLAKGWESARKQSQSRIMELDRLLGSPSLPNEERAEYLRQWEVVVKSSEYILYNNLKAQEGGREDQLREKSKDWRNMVFSDYWALAALGSLEE